MSQLVKKIKIPKIIDDCELFFAQHPNSLPFPLHRVYFISKPKPGLSRGFHAHRKTHQVLICLTGQCRLVLDDGHRRKSILLTRPDFGIYLPPLSWHEMHNLTQKTILLVFASRIYDSDDYIRDYQEFLSLVKKNAKH